MALDATGRARTAAQWQRENQLPTPWTRADLTAAVAAVDDWIDANQASYNTALPTAVRTGATAAQKIDLMMYVLLRRQGRLRAEED
jgi:hypothetical protein